MKKIITAGIVFALTIPIYAGDQISEPNNSPNQDHSVKETTKELKAEDFSWADKKFSIGFEPFTGFGFIGSIHAVTLAQLNMRVWLVPHIEMSIHGGLNTTLFINVFAVTPQTIETSVPVILNIGYGDSIKNMHWYIEGGGGYNLDREGPIVNASAGIELLIFKHYSLGLKFTGGIIYRNGSNSNWFVPATFTNLSITGNLVF